MKLDIQGQGDGRILDVEGQRGWGSWKLDNFHGCHMCIIPNSMSFWTIFLSKIVYFRLKRWNEIRFAASWIFRFSSSCFLIKSCSLTNNCKGVNSIVKLSIFCYGCYFRYYLSSLHYSSSDFLFASCSFHILFSIRI